MFCSLQWNLGAQGILQNTQLNAASVFTSVANIANLYPTIAHQSGASLPFLTLKDFEAYGKQVRDSNGIVSIAFAPFIKDSGMRMEWEQYSADESSWIAHAYSDYPELAGGHKNYSATIWKYDSEGQAVESPDNSAPYLPSWQMSPPPPVASRIVNFDYASTATVSKGMQWAAASKMPILSEILGDKELDGLGLAHGEAPVSLVLQPVFNSLDASSASIVGMLVAALPWTIFFDGILHEGQKGVLIVAESCGVNSSFILNGPKAYYLGPGDLHDAKYDGSVQKAELLESTEDEKYCENNLYAFPSHLLDTQTSTSQAVALCASVVAVFVVAAILFLVYDVNLRRSLKVNERINHSMEGKALLHHVVVNESCMHGNDVESVPKQLSKLQGKDDTLVKGFAESEKATNNEAMAEAAMETKDALMKYVSTSAKPETGSKPIAELFPEATVLFADISGFTAWSSIREPSQVFTLLESIFGAFDAIAHERGVFKVETVGDCYVAVCGLPEPNKDHAIVMARFARECMEKVNEIIRELELTLGPDTAELAMRFGVHSGPITAGVLRGDRARFQLFGDTVNTAARIETTGKRNRIHLSEQTASLIMATGRKNWVIEVGFHLCSQRFFRSLNANTCS